MKTIEINSSNEWLEVFSGLDFEGVDESDTDEAAKCFTNHLHELLAEVGFATAPAKGQRITCHGWNGANTFRTKIGPCGTFDELTDAEMNLIYDAIPAAQERRRQKWFCNI